MSRDLVEIVHELRMQLAKRGGLSMKTLGLAFAVNDRDRSGMFDFEEFEGILGRAGLFLKRQELTKLFRYFDRDQNERVSYDEFLRGLMGELNERRTSIIRQAFARMDKNGNGTIELDDVVGTYDASKHPLVISGQKTPEAILTEFIEGFKDHSTGSSVGSSGVVTWEQWVDYYRGVSASIPDDDYFVFMMQQAWHITESASIGSDVPLALLQKIENVLREKIRQKSSPTASEAETLRKAFKHFDLDSNETVTYSEFLLALERFGIVLEEKVSRALFLDFDTSRSGRISYAEFAKVLYRNDPIAIAIPATTAAPVETKEDMGSEDYFGDMKSFGAPASAGAGAGAGAAYGARPPSRPLDVVSPSSAAAAAAYGGGGGGYGRPPSRPMERPLSRPPSGLASAGAAVVRPPSRPPASYAASSSSSASAYRAAPSGGAAAYSSYGSAAPSMSRPLSRPGAAPAPSPFRAVGTSVTRR